MINLHERMFLESVLYVMFPHTLVTMSAGTDNQTDNRKQCIF